MNTVAHPESPPTSARQRFRSALISTAGHCKIACGFCFRADRAHGFLDISTYARALSRLKEIGVEAICLTGGEPTHHPDLRQLLRLAHQFGIPVSIVTSARDPDDVDRLADIAHLLANVTVSADSAGAMELGRTTRSVSSAMATLEQVPTSVRVLHLTYWKLTARECQNIYEHVDESGVQIQLSPVALDDTARQRAGRTFYDYLAQQREDADLLGRYFQLSPRFQEHLATLRAMQLYPERQPFCASAVLYVSASGEIRRCPYSRSGVSVRAPRAEISSFLHADPLDRTTAECAAICRADDTCE
ncbi:radical SAM protein [Streptomyces diastatochromogenes]|uniref:Radical SAM protein n=1 Tax=Streptomyces diastatochromogenes TaxID=42236 RepID=A0A233S890_STRDA|nr:radical SAM protein [Streptomyces diastatochromogenes]MCZ0990399.1 radical SAM protein [Streptomyces diastatochromogenes]OXY91891.1 radical SAM protein [Streptomyces diastatochromogenes]